VPILALHPGSGSDKKNWPEPSWAALLECLAQANDFHFLLVGGEAEGDRVRRLAARMPAGRLRVAQNLPLVELAALLEGCAAFVGHDSGISHLAAALGLPGLVLWGQSAERLWRPPSDKVVVVRHPGALAQLTVAEVLEELQRLIRREILV
jgi:heptosyltransferase-2